MVIPLKCRFCLPPPSCWIHFGFQPFFEIWLGSTVAAKLRLVMHLECRPQRARTASTVTLGSKATADKMFAVFDLP